MEISWWSGNRWGNKGKFKGVSLKKNKEMRREISRNR